MSRLKTVRKQKSSSTADVRDRLVPLAADARDAAVTAAGTARDWAAPRVDTAREWAAPRVEAVREDVLPKVAGAVTAALVATEPVREEARHRGAAAVLALKGELPPPAPRRRRAGKLVVLLGMLGAAFAAWKAWSAQGAGEPEPWAPPTAPPPPLKASTPTQAAPGTAATVTPITGTGDAPPPSDDVAGASPDEALADHKTPLADEAAGAVEDGRKP